MAMALVIERFTPRDLGPRTWGTETLIAHGPDYIGKILRMRAGSAGGLQYHRQKDEAGILWEGIIEIDHDNGSGQLTALRIESGACYRFPPGAVHRVRAITDVIIFEVSSPHFDDRVRVEALYGLPEVDGLPTTEDSTR